MNHFILLTFLSCSYSSFSSAQLNAAQNADAELYRKNQVKSVKVYEYRTAIKLGQGKMTSCKNLDTLGREIETWSKLKLGFLHRPIEYRVKYKYNQNGDVAERTSFVLKIPRRWSQSLRINMTTSKATWRKPHALKSALMKKELQMSGSGNTMTEAISFN